MGSVEIAPAFASSAYCIFIWQVLQNTNRLVPVCCNTKTSRTILPNLIWTSDCSNAFESKFVSKTKTVSVAGGNVTTCGFTLWTAFKMSFSCVFPNWRTLQKALRSEWK